MCTHIKGCMQITRELLDCQTNTYSVINMEQMVIPFLRNPDCRTWNQGHIDVVLYLVGRDAEVSYLMWYVIMTSWSQQNEILRIQSCHSRYSEALSKTRTGRLCNCPWNLQREKGRNSWWQHARNWFWRLKFEDNEFEDNPRSGVHQQPMLKSSFQLLKTIPVPDC